jgi:foldase protein PrsA
MKKWILSLSLAAGVVGLAACGNGGDNTVVKTDEGNVTKEDLYNAMKEKYPQQTQQALQELVYKKVLSKKYKVSDKEVNNQLQKMKEQLGPQYEAFLAQYGMDEKAFKDYLKLELLQQKAATADIKISDQELKDYYKKWQPEIRVRHILVKDEKKANEIEAQLQKGAKFEDLAKKYSQDTGSAKKGGDLGWINYQDRKQFVPEFSKALDTLKVNEISKPVKTEYGYHIIQITDKKKKKPFNEVKDQLKEELKLSKVDQSKMQKTLDKVLKDADIKVEDKDFKGLFPDVTNK